VDNPDVVQAELVLCAIAGLIKPRLGFLLLLLMALRLIDEAAALAH
jgi:hypothetical protein